jgi:hypothetical protein
MSETMKLKTNRRIACIGVLLTVLIGGAVVTQTKLGTGLLWCVFDLFSKKDWWAGEGETDLAIPPSLSERIGSGPFHWRILIHRTADGEASVILCLTRTRSVFPVRPGRSFWHYGHMQEPGLGDRCIIMTNVRLPWEEFSQPWHRGIDGEWRFEGDGDAFSVTSIATEESIPLSLDNAWWEDVLAYHYWTSEDGPEPSHEDLPR